MMPGAITPDRTGIASDAAHVLFRDDEVTQQRLCCSLPDDVAKSPYILDQIIFEFCP